MLDLRSRQPDFGANPGVEQAQAGDASVSRLVAIQEGSRRTVAQPPKNDALHPCHARSHQVDGCADVAAHVFEVARFAATVAHASVVESQHRITGLRQHARQHHKLTMAAGPVLRAADDHDDSGVERPLRD